MQRIRQAVEQRQEGERAVLTQAISMLNKRKTELVKAKFRHRIHHRGRVTNRIFCAKKRKETDLGNASFDNCKAGCMSAVKIEEMGV